MSGSSGRRAPPPLAYLSGVALAIFFLAPLTIMIVVSFFKRVPGGFYKPEFDLGSYARFLTSFFLDQLSFSLIVAASASTVCVLLATPFTYLLTRQPRRTQIAWLVLLLSVLALSEVIVGFSWSVLLSRTAGLSNLLVWLGLLDQPVAWVPGLPAMLLGLSYLLFPYSVLVLYPSMARLPTELVEAARTMGASPTRAFFDVVLPHERRAILSTFVMGFVFTLGAYLIPQLLGRPQHWTLSVLITDQAIFQSNLPFASAMAMFLLTGSMLLILLVTRVAGSRPGKRVA